MTFIWLFKWFLHDFLGDFYIVLTWLFRRFLYGFLGDFYMIFTWLFRRFLRWFLHDFLADFYIKKIIYLYMSENRLLSNIKNLKVIVRVCLAEFKIICLLILVNFKIFTWPIYILFGVLLKVHFSIDIDNQKMIYDIVL